MYLPIEKILILKTVDVFAELGDATLADLAAVTDEVELGEGETLFEKGETGTSMYVVARGRVRVHDGDHTLVELGERSCFGELAMIDAERRSASVTALEETMLLCVSQAAFYELMADSSEVADAILRVLCRRIRRRSVDVQKQRREPDSGAKAPE
ncbi:MAG: cyclic nucleotide-binding domain-containing protein [bacterium]|nr:cyclic nucleotide-binding domain-containing protein [bacterium]